MPKQIYTTEELRLKAKRQATAKYLIKKGKKTLADYDADWRSVAKPKPRTLLSTRAAKAARMDNEFVPMVMRREDFDENFMKLFQEYYDYKNGGLCMDGELLTQNEEDTHYTEIGSIIKEAQNKIEWAVWEAEKKWEAAIEKQAIKKQTERKEEEEEDEEIIMMPKKKKTKGKNKLLIIE